VARDIIWLYIIVLLTSAISQFFEPAQSSVLPEVATDEELTAANSLMAISSFGSTAVGFAAAGFLAAGSIDLAFYIDAATFIFSALCVWLVRIAPFASNEVTNIASILRNMRSGMQYLFGTPILRSAFVLFPAIGLSLGLWNA